MTTAQEGTPAPGSSLIIHVVQRDETLFQIAQQYGVELDAIITANSLVDPDRLAIGQRLMIPNPNTDSPGMVTTHTVEAGETLQTIAARYSSTVDSLSQINKIPHNEALYIGQKILVTAGANGTLPDTISLHVVQPGDNWFRVSLLYRLPVRTLADYNQLDPHDPLQVGQFVIIPGVDTAGRFVDFPPPLRDFQLMPLPAVQGRTLQAVITVHDPAVTISGQFLDKPIQLAQSGHHYHAMLGIHAFTDPGIYPLSLQLTDPDGNITPYTARIFIAGGGYGQEAINIPAERQNLLSPDMVQSELDRVTAIMSGFTPVAYFDGLMSLPSVGAVTSQYGTRRSYNGSPFDTFHGGTDFGGAPGSAIMAPAGGVVVLAEPLNVRGNTIILDHGWGVYTGYWHLTDLLVTTGQRVQRGDQIGTLGATGLVTGAHLHWEMWVSGVQVDPMQWVSYSFLKGQ